MSCENTDISEKEDLKEKLCPICNGILIERGLYYCSNCKRYFDPIDCLKIPPEQVDESCKLCYFLKKTKWKKIGWDGKEHTLYYCNSIKGKKPMEIIRDFRKCKDGFIEASEKECIIKKGKNNE